MCVLADPSVPQKKFTRTDPAFSLSPSLTHSHTLSGTLSRTHARTHTQPVFSSLSVKASILNLGLFVTEKPTINKPPLFRQVFKIVIFLLILYRLYIFYLHTERRQCGDNSKSLQTCPMPISSAVTLCCLKMHFLNTFLDIRASD